MQRQRQVMREHVGKSLQRSGVAWTFLNVCGHAGLHVHGYCWAEFAEMPPPDCCHLVLTGGQVPGNSGKKRTVFARKPAVERTEA
jgi:hypothetical protein